MEKILSYHDLIMHLNPKICEKWLKSGENEFGCLFCGLNPNEIKGIRVLDCIKNMDVPFGKKVMS